MEFYWEYKSIFFIEFGAFVIILKDTEPKKKAKNK